MNTARIVFLYPSLQGQLFWHPVLAAFTKLYPTTTIYTARWPGFRKGYENTFDVRLIGARRGARDISPDQIGFLPLPVRAMARHLLALRPAVIFTSAFSLWSFIAAALKPVAGWKIIVLYDGCSAVVDRRDSTVNTAWRRLIAAAADAFLTNTDAGRAYLHEHLHVPPERIRRHLYELPSPDFQTAPPPEEPGSDEPGSDEPGSPVRFVTVCRLIPVKGLTYLFDAARRLHARHPRGFTLSIIGDGPARAALQTRAARYGLEDQIEWLGARPHHQVGRLLQQGDVFVFTTLGDVLGVAPLEAMLAGLPAICSRYAGAAEYVTEGRSGFVVDPRDVTTLADRMAWFIHNRHRIPEMGRFARKTLQPYTPSEAATVFHHTVDALL